MSMGPYICCRVNEWMSTVKTTAIWVKEIGKEMIIMLYQNIDDAILIIVIEDDESNRPGRKKILPPASMSAAEMNKPH